MGNNNDDLLVTLLNKLGLDSTSSGTSIKTNSNLSSPSTVSIPNFNHVAYHAYGPPGLVYYPASVQLFSLPPQHIPAQAISSPVIPPSFGYQQAQSVTLTHQPYAVQQVYHPPQYTYPAQTVGPTQPAANSPAVGPTPITVHSGTTTSTGTTGQETVLPHAFTVGTLHDLTTDAWNMNTDASSHLNNLVTSLNENFHTCMYPFISVGDGHSIPVTNMGHSILPTPTKSLHLNNVLITPHIVKNLIYVRQFVRDNNCTIEFDAFGFS
ncbi:hypothetical protein Tco_1181003 [Tanacetum coccineum]